MILFFILFTFFLNDANHCIKLLKSKQYKRSVLSFRSIKADNSESYQFLKAYYTRDASLGIKTFKKLYLHSRNSDIKYLSAQKLYEYYYSLGYYEKAQNLKQSKLLATPQKVVYPKRFPKTTSKEYFVLQCGVFGSEKNAISQKRMIVKKIKNQVYLEKDYIDGQTIFRVYVGKFASYKEAEQVNLNLKKKYKIGGFVKSIKK